MKAGQTEENEDRSGDEVDEIYRRIGEWLREKSGHTGLHDWLMVVFTGALVTVAVQQCSLSRDSFKSSGTQVQQIIEATHRIEDAADSFSGSAAHINTGVSDAVGKLNLQAGATKTLADASRDSLTKVQRAFLEPVVTQTNIFSPETARFTSASWSIRWQNDGTTVASRVTSHNNSAVGGPAPDFREDRWPQNVAHINTPTYIPPKGNAYSGAIETLTDNELRTILLYKTHIYFWGWARYHDVFSKTKTHITRYCYDYVLIANRTDDPKSTAGAMTLPTNCLKGNCIDEECKDQ